MKYKGNTNDGYPVLKLLMNGKWVERHASLDSTNTRAMEWIREERVQHASAVFALLQTMGRGQRGNRWHAQANEGMTASWIVVPDAAYADGQWPVRLQWASALCFQEALKGLGLSQLQLKWPNDLYVESGKLGGLLIETNWQGQEAQASVLGLGINLNQQYFPLEIQGISMRQLGFPWQDPWEVFRYLHSQVVDRLTFWAHLPMPALHQAYEVELMGKGSWLEFKKQGLPYVARVVGVDEQNRLVTKNAEGMVAKHGIQELTWQVQAP